jgi:hypothetical protein
VSEGIVDDRVTHGLLPASDTRILDVGPSYIVVSAIAVAVLYGSWLARLAAALDLVALVFVGHIFSGLSRLDVTAVGHTAAITVAVLLGSLLAWQLRRGRPLQRDGVPQALPDAVPDQAAPARRPAAEGPGDGRAAG